MTLKGRGWEQGSGEAVSQEDLERIRNESLRSMAQQTQKAWEPYLQPGGQGLRNFGEPARQAALQQVAMPQQSAAAYSQTAGIGGPVGPAFPGADQMPGMQAKIQSFVSYMNTLTGPMSQELAMLDAEALAEWHDSIGRLQAGV